MEELKKFFGWAKKSGLKYLGAYAVMGLVNYGFWSNLEGIFANNHWAIGVGALLIVTAPVVALTVMMIKHYIKSK